VTVRVLPRDRGRVAPGFLPSVPDHVLPWLAGELGPVERIAMREIIEGADLIFVDGTTYLIAPVSPRCIDALSMFEAEGEDRVNDLEDEPDADDEPSEDPEPEATGAPVPNYPDDPEKPQYVNGGSEAHPE
jgi:hypothetical protein